MKRHNPYTAAGRAGLRRVIAYERRRFGWVRGTVADRIMTALEDEHARPANQPNLRHLFDEIGYEIANGSVAATALLALQLVAEAATQAARQPIAIESTGGKP